MTKKQYVDLYWEAAKKACADSGIYPILALAESAVESGWGESKLTKEGLNFFGVKAYSGWKGATITKNTKEFDSKGNTYYINAAFKKYDTAYDSFKDYVKVVSGTRYTKTGTLEAGDPNQQIKSIAAGGYSTAPTYAGDIIKIMNGLNSYVPDSNSINQQIAANNKGEAPFNKNKDSNQMLVINTQPTGRLESTGQDPNSQVGTDIGISGTLASVSNVFKPTIKPEPISFNIDGNGS